METMPLACEEEEKQEIDYSPKVLQLLGLVKSMPDNDQVIIKACPKPYNKSASQRKSKYRGVSKNGAKWQVGIYPSYQCLQVLIMGGEEKQYYGAIETENKAGRLYDKLSMEMNGLAVSSPHF